MASRYLILFPTKLVTDLACAKAGKRHTTTTISGLITTNSAMGILMLWSMSQNIWKGSNGSAAVNWEMMKDARRQNINLVAILS
jgi:lipid II:glycine glycyltransferase (peptidoglycan interpeptide bridge formation enzyme)